MWLPCKTKKERREKVQKLLMENNKAVLRGIIAIYNRQTMDEKVAESTKQRNHQGFCAHDAPLLSLYAKQILQYGGLSPQQLNIARDRIIRYTKQLADIAEIKERKNHG